MPCTYCGITVGDGISTNFDPYGTRRKLGLPVEKFQFICLPCWKKEGAEKDAHIRKETTQAVRDRGACGFVEAWTGHCLNSTPCPQHQKQKCWKCQEPAVKNCPVAGSLVCGVPECADHPHIHERSF